MEFTSKLKWIVVVFSLLFFLIFVGWGLSSIARNVFNGSSSTQNSETVKGVNVEDVDTVRFIVDGPVVASTDHRSYKIEISSNVVSMKVFSDYGQKVLREKSYLNNDQAYENFVKSLEKSGATRRQKNTNVDDDYNEKGACPTGRRYILELEDIERRWTTSCQKIKGTAINNMSTIRSLFNSQIPDFKELVKDTKLNR